VRERVLAAISIAIITTLFDGSCVLYSVAVWCSPLKGKYTWQRIARKWRTDFLHYLSPFFRPSLFCYRRDELQALIHRLANVGKHLAFIAAATSHDAVKHEEINGKIPRFPTQFLSHQINMYNTLLSKIEFLKFCLGKFRSGSDCISSYLAYTFFFECRCRHLLFKMKNAYVMCSD